MKFDIVNRWTHPRTASANVILAEDRAERTRAATWTALAIQSVNVERADPIILLGDDESCARIVAGAIADYFDIQIEKAERLGADHEYIRALEDGRDDLALIAVGEDRDAEDRKRIATWRYEDKC